MERMIFMSIVMIMCYYIRICCGQTQIGFQSYQPQLVGDQIIWNAKIEHYSYQVTYLYVFTLLNINQSLKISKVIYFNSMQKSSLSKVYNFSSKVNEPKIHFTKTKILFNFKTNSSINLRFLFFKSNLSKESSHQYDIDFNGLYSQKHDVFYLKSNTSSIIYSNLNNNIITSYNIKKSQTYKIDYVLGLGQNKLIKLFQGVNKIEIRNMNNFDKVESYETYGTIQLLNDHYQCFCLNLDQSQLMILDSLGFLIKVDLVMQSIKSNISIGLYNQRKCFMSQNSTNHIHFVEYSSSGNLVIFSSFQQTNNLLSYNYYNNPYGDLDIDMKSRSIIQRNSKKVYFNTRFQASCQLYGFYNDLSLCKYCMINCFQCTSSSNCLQCTTGLFDVNLGSCPPQNITATVNNNTNQDNSTNPSNSSTNSTQLSQKDHDFSIKMPDGSVQTMNLTQNEKILLNCINNGFTYSNSFLQNAMIMLSTFPYLYFFLSSINFFSICSLYIFLNVKVPYQLYQMLILVQQTLNHNIISFLGIKFRFSFIPQQKIKNNKFIDAGLSSNFIQSNHQIFLSFIIMLFLLFMMRLLSKYFDKYGLIHRIFNQNYSEVIIGVLLSNISQIILPYLSIFTDLSFIDFSSRANLFIQSVFIGLFLILIAFVISFISISVISKESKKKADKSKSKNLHSKSQSKLQQQKQTIYYGFNNLIFGLLVVIDNPIYFLIIGQLFSLIGIYKACSYRRWRINRIILSLYPIIFHLCFVIFYLSNDMSLLVYTFIVCSAVYVMGSFHEIAMIIAQLIDFLIRYIRSSKAVNKIGDIAANDQVIEKVEKVERKKQNLTFNTTQQASNFYKAIIFQMINGKSQKLQLKQDRKKCNIEVKQIKQETSLQSNNKKKTLL